MGHCLIQPVAAFADIQKGKRAAVSQTQGNIQVAQADVTVDAKNPFTGPGKGRGDTGTDGGFSRSALSGQKRDQFAHLRHPLSIVWLHYNGISHKKQEEIRVFKRNFISFHKNGQMCLENNGNKNVNKIFMKKVEFPLAFLGGLGYYILALRELEC